jgi:hypothetical protein
MADIVRERVLTTDQATELIGTKVPDADPDITSETILIDADTGAIVLAYLPLDRDLVRQLRRQIVGFRCATVQRNANYETRSSTFGFSPRSAINGREDCRASMFARDEPDRQQVLTATADRLRKMLADIDQSIVDDDLATLSVIENDWFLGESELWTSGVINQSSELPYHRDSFNFPTWSAMPVLRRGMDGGRLSVPEYGATIACRDGWVVFFPGHDLVHGVTPMRAQAVDAYRYSIVYYALRGMKDCHSAAVETAWARKRRTERERAMAKKITERTSDAAQ